MACSQQRGQPNPQSLNNPCDQIKHYIEQAQAIASSLEDLNWNEFSNVGVLCPPEGICRVGTLPIVEKGSVPKEFLEHWVPLAEQLPSPQTAKTYSIQCANCLELAVEACSQNRYNETQIPMPEADKLTAAQWQELCVQLQSALMGTEYLASRDKIVAAEHTFPKMLVYFNASDEKIKQKYLTKFMTKSENSIQLHDELIHNIQRAEQVAIELTPTGN